jgi:hypothetical protein
MVKLKIPESLPKCKLIELLAERANDRKDTSFNFIGRLDEVRGRIAAEITRINVLFPEFTPHDEEYHIKHLFHIADKILGTSIIEKMNSAELFILCVSLYAHDWGMAVSDADKEYIIGNLGDDDIELDKLWILPDDKIRYHNFLKKQGIIDDGKLSPEIINKIWRAYARETHHLRSGERIRRYFEDKDPGVGEAASRICISHGIDFEELEDFKLYPSDFTVLNEPTNLRALSIYLRLIDMLDLGRDRTPFVLWKFVAPKDPRSNIEWLKHTSLQEITTANYQVGREIIVDGSTDSHEIYAALQDFKDWCDKQFWGCMDILARLGDDRHKLDIHRINWRIAASHFKPISIKFEFDRYRMFEILGDEIYQGNPYVFLRELLQNSIDAIRMRREVLKLKKLMPNDLGLIQVMIDHKDNGDVIITWSDDGIGMDEYIVRNYLSVAGKSYYQSEDFQREGLKMDPISRFGVGILSCFMVSDHIEIETFKEPYMPPRAEPLRIVIPDKTKQFRIEVLNIETAEVGTKVKIFIDGRKLPVDKETGKSEPLNCTDYLCSIAGFVEFPILVNEYNKKTIILHPKQNPDLIKEKVGEVNLIKQENYNYPWDNILPQDTSIAKTIFSEKRLTIFNDQPSKRFEGVISLLIPEPSIDFYHTYNHGERIIKRYKPKEKIGFIRITTQGKFRYLPYANSASIRRSKMVSVFKDGILIPNVKDASFIERDLSWDLPGPYVVLNLSDNKSFKTDLARKQILPSEKRWDYAIAKDYYDIVLRENAESIKSLEPLERMYQIARIGLFWCISNKNLYSIFPNDNWPVCSLTTKGLIGNEWKFIYPDEIKLCPRIISDRLSEFIKNQLITGEKYTGILNLWKGPDIYFKPNHILEHMQSVKKCIDLSWYPIRQIYSLSKCHFVVPPWKDNPPLLQEIWEISKDRGTRRVINETITKAINNAAILDSSEFEDIAGVIFGNWRLPKISTFEGPYNNLFAYSWEMLNKNHYITKHFIKMIANIAKAKLEASLSPIDIGILSDMLRSLPYPEANDQVNCSDISTNLRKIWEYALSLGLINSINIDDFLPVASDFVPGSIGDNSDISLRIYSAVKDKAFGMVL